MPGDTTLALSVGTHPTRQIRVLPVTVKDFQQLHEQGGRGLSSTDVGCVRSLVRLTRFEGKSGQSLHVPDGRDGCVLLVGCGPDEGTGVLRRAAAAATALIPGRLEWSLILPDHWTEIERAPLLRAAAEGVLLSTYRFRTGAATAAAESPGRCEIVTRVTSDVARIALERVRASAAGVFLTRDLVNTPASDLGPTEFANLACELARRHGMETALLRDDQVKEQGFRLVEAVGRGSSRRPTVTLIRHQCPPGQRPALALVGKGVVFDSGGLNLKTPDGMLLMRKDMAGAATILGALDAVGRLGIALPLLAVLPAAENLVGPDCFRPGDVIQSYSGLTVEIANTDAEGRLLLADGLSFARDQGARRLLDLATLTLAARVALGPDVPALFGTDDALLGLLEDTSRQNDEPMWRLPLVSAYDSKLETPFADVSHFSSDNRGSAITAALFLRRFAKDTPWVHVDLYGWEDQGKPETPKGASGHGVRTLVDLLGRLAEQSRSTAAS